MSSGISHPNLLLPVPTVLRMLVLELLELALAPRPRKVGAAVPREPGSDTKAAVLATAAAAAAVLDI